MVILVEGLENLLNSLASAQLRGPRCRRVTEAYTARRDAFQWKTRGFFIRTSPRSRIVDAVMRWRTSIAAMMDAAGRERVSEVG